MTDDDEMMSVDLSFANGTARAEVPVQLFQQRTTNTGHYFGFDPVGPRFLLTVEPVANQATPLTVVLNWAAGLKQ